MSEPVVKDLINFTICQTDNLPTGLQENSHQQNETSNLGNNFNINLNKTFNLNKYDHIMASNRIKTVLEPLNKNALDCTNQKKEALGNLSKRESLESNESLGILPDLLKDEMNFDNFQSELGFSDDEIPDCINSEINENPTSFVFSPLSDNQFNRISLFLKNISTPLPNFGNDRRCSSTPKISAASQFVANTADIEHYSSPQFLPDEKEEPIAGSCHIKFEADFNLDDFNNVKPLTSTYKTFAPLQLSTILSELDDETSLISEVKFKQKHELIENNLDVTQTFSHNFKDFCEREDDIQNVNILNNTFKIKQPISVESTDVSVPLKCSIPVMKISQAGLNNCSKKEKVKTLDSTFEMPRNKISSNVDCEKTFVVDFNSDIHTGATSNSIYDKRLNETCVLDVNSIELLSKQEKIGDATFTKDLESDMQTSLELCCSSHSTVSKPITQILEKTFSRNGLKPILEETLSENDLNEMLACSVNFLPCVNSKSQLGVDSETFNIKTNVTSENVELLLSQGKFQSNFPIEFASPNSPKALASNIFHEAGEKIGFHDQINLAESKKDLSKKISIEGATIPEKINEQADKKFENFCKNSSTENVNSIIELASPKTLVGTTFNEEVRRNISLHNQIDHTENEYDLSDKMCHSDPLQSVSNNTFFEKSEVVGKFCKKNSIQNESSSEFSSSLFSKLSKSLTFFDKSEVANVDSNVFENSDLIEKGNPNLKNFSSGNAAYSLSLNQCYTHHAETNFTKAIKDIFTENPYKETKFSTRTISEEGCPSEIFPKLSNAYVSTVFSEKNDRFQVDMDSVLKENYHVRPNQNPAKEMTNTSFFEETGEVQIEQTSILIENDKFETSLNSQKEIYPPFSGLAENCMKVPPKIQVDKCDQFSLGETVASNLTKVCLKDTLSRDVTNKSSSSIKNCSLKSKTVTKNRLIKPTKIAYPREVFEQCNSELPFPKTPCKTLDHKKSIASNFNRTLNLYDNSTDKSFSKNFNRRLTLSCSSESEANKHTIDFKKSFGIPLNLGIQKPELSFQKSKLNIKPSNGNVKEQKQNLLPQPELISCKNPKIVKSVAVTSVIIKEPTSNLRFHGKLPLKSLKINEKGLKSIKTLEFTAEKSNDKVISCPKVMDLPRKEKMPEGDLNSNSGKNDLKHSIAANLPRKSLSFSNIPNKTCNSKPTAIKQKCAPSSNTCKPNSLKPSSSLKPPDTIVKPKFSSLPKFQSSIKFSSGESKSKIAINKKPVSGNQKTNNFLIKHCIPEGEAVQILETQINTGHVKQKDNTRESAQPTSPMVLSREKTVQSLNPSNIKKTNSQCSFLPMPKTARNNIKCLNSNDVLAVQESEFQNQVCQRTSGRLSQLQKIPAPRYKK